jgi:mRNA interferase MazF
MNIKRGDVFYADLRPVMGSEQGGIRPVVIIQNDIGNRYSPTVICAAITSKMNKAKMPTHIEIAAGDLTLARDSVILLEQIRTVDKMRLKDRICHLPAGTMNQIDDAIRVSLGLLDAVR